MSPTHKKKIGKMCSFFFLWRYIAKKHDLILLIVVYRSFRQRKIAYLDPEEISESETCTFYAKRRNFKLDRIWPDLRQESGWMMWEDLPRAKYTRKYVSHDMFVTYIFSDPLWPVLDIVKHDLCTLVAPSQDTYQPFGWFWSLCNPSNRS